MFLRAYLRASTKEQDANRAKDDLIAFAKERGLKIAAFYIENESGASLDRPELFRLLSDSQPVSVRRKDFCWVERCKLWASLSLICHDTLDHFGIA